MIPRIARPCVVVALLAAVGVAGCYNHRLDTLGVLHVTNLSGLFEIEPEPFIREWRQG
jgi:hypothetical protein